MTIQLVPRVDRRSATRLAEPACIRCADRGVTIAVIRTTRFVYFRCSRCGDIQPKLIPVLTLPHGLVARLSDGADSR